MIVETVRGIRYSGLGIRDCLIIPQAAEQILAAHFSASYMKLSPSADPVEVLTTSSPATAPHYSAMIDVKSRTLTLSPLMGPRVLVSFNASGPVHLTM